MSDGRGNTGRAASAAPTARPGGARPGFGPGAHRGGPMGLGAPAEKAKNFGGSIRRLVRYLRPRLAPLLAVVALAVVSTSFSVVAPKIIGNTTTMIARGLGSGAIDFSAIGQTVVFLIALYLVSALFGFSQQYLMAGVAQKTVYDMRREVSEKLARLPLSYFDGRTHGEIMSRVTNDLDNIASTLQQSLGQVVNSAVTILGVIIMMFTISPLLSAITLVVLPLSFLMTRIIAPRSQKYFADQWKHIGELNGHVEEMYTGHSIVTAFGRERASIEKFNAVNDKVYEASWRAQFVSGLLFPLMSFINNIGYVAVAVAGGIMVAVRTLAIGDILAFIQYSRQFTMPIAQVANIANILQSTAASAERVFELLDEKEEEADRPDSIEFASPRGDVRFDGVWFSYKEDAPLIEEMDLDVKEGQTIAIVGPTGAGKTTLVNLLMRFYETRKGRILVDGKDVRDLRRGSLRRGFGMVLQDTWLFNGTIRENIAYGKEGATDEEVHQAAAAAHADHFIRTLPEGYATVLNEEGSNISQGQKQLLTIARAILIDPPMLILDEATSSVDTRTEVLIRRAMARLMAGRTSFVIAHRLSTIRDAKLILVMNKGKIIETGTHAELLARGGFYAELYNSQFTVAAVEAEEAVPAVGGAAS
jgi:ATP-binding cassette, subfamily B, multidrug efflux pump